MNQVAESRPQTSAASAGIEAAVKPIVSPTRLAHVVMRSSQFDALIEWYKTVLGARLVFSGNGLAFLAYDDEHHRIAIIDVPGLKPQPAGIAGVHHIAFTYGSLNELIETYERLEAAGIPPVWCTNHGPTTSMYYADPDGNQVELQVDNYPTVEEAGEFFFSQAFATNPIGVDFDPADLARRVRSGEAEAAIKLRPASGPRGVETIKLR